MTIINELKELLNEDPWTDDLLSTDWLVEFSGNWEDNHKSEAKFDVVRHKESGRYFGCHFSRTGDHWQGYETSLDDVAEVEPYTKTITAWRQVTVKAATLAMAKGGLNDEADTE